MTKSPPQTTLQILRAFVEEEAGFDCDNLSFTTRTSPHGWKHSVERGCKVCSSCRARALLTKLNRKGKKCRTKSKK